MSVKKKNNNTRYATTERQIKADFPETRGKNHLIVMDLPLGLALTILVLTHSDTRIGHIYNIANT